MSAIWLLTTRGRPDACQQVLDACVETGMTSPGIVYVDETADLYRKIRLPANWSIRRTNTWGSIAASMRYCRRRYPDATQYGWLADDTVPISEAWDVALEQAAGNWHISYANDRWMALDPGWAHYVRAGSLMTSGLCWGASLIRAAGWWALPGVRQGGIDGAWNTVSHELDLGRYLDNVVIEHRTWKAGKRRRDKTDAWVKHGQAYIAADVKRYWKWEREECPRLVKRLRKLVPA
jgi:hypothetical protein